MIRICVCVRACVRACVRMLCLQVHIHQVVSRFVGRQHLGPISGLHMHLSLFCLNLYVLVKHGILVCHDWNPGKFAGFLCHQYGEICSACEKNLK